MLRRRVRVSLSFVLFVILCAVTGAGTVVSVCWGCDVYYGAKSRWTRAGVLGNLGMPRID